MCLFSDFAQGFVLFPVTESGSPEVEVTLSILSGNPNPGWIFDHPDDIARLQELLNGLPATEPIEEPDFGPFHLATNGGAISELPALIVVFDGIIKVRTGGTISFFQDSNGLLDFLIEEAVRRGILDIIVSTTTAGQQKTDP